MRIGTGKNCFSYYGELVMDLKSRVINRTVYNQIKIKSFIILAVLLRSLLRVGGAYIRVIMPGKAVVFTEVFQR